ncbi:MAG TPA: DUF479 domain-containing protein [Flavobacteriales bacterium]|nr:DUF479 domain-containing protein [Flavobacteriales bacterium]
MNFLAHLLLSGANDEIRIGNFIADSVKGSDLSKFSATVQTGILLHRKIDHYTDNHPVVMKSKVRLRPQFHKYSPVIVDVFYDHFLAKNWNNYASQPLEEFIACAYKLLSDNFELIPGRTQMMLPYMIKDNWLLHYREIEGIRRALTGMARRSKFESKMEYATISLEKNYKQFQEEFETFFPELITKAEQWTEELMNR